MSEEARDFIDLERAIKIAIDAHAGQTDKGGAPYILHPLRVMHAVWRYGEATMKVAVLHDVLEDTDVWLLIGDRLIDSKSFDSLGCLTGEEGTALCALTRSPDEPYSEYIARLAPDTIARRIKIADLKDNTDPDRFMQEHYRQPKGQRQRYLASLRILQEAEDQA